MRLLGLLGSVLVFIYVVGVILLTWHNISKWLFTLSEPGKDAPRIRFWMRQFLILVWPLVLSSSEGRHALQVIWTGKDDRAWRTQEDYEIFGGDFQTRNTPPRTSNRRED